MKPSALVDGGGGLMSDHIGLAKVAEDENAEQVMILIDDAEKRRQLAHTMSSPYPLDEATARAELAAIGESQASIAAMVQRARAHFQARNVGRAFGLRDNFACRCLRFLCRRNSRHVRPILRESIGSLSRRQSKNIDSAAGRSTSPPQASLTGATRPSSDRTRPRFRAADLEDSTASEQESRASYPRVPACFSS
jgi:hypothetical protein